LDELFELEFDELFELEFDELLELEFDELFELEFEELLELELDALSEPERRPSRSSSSRSRPDRPRPASPPERDGDPALDSRSSSSEMRPTAARKSRAMLSSAVDNGMADDGVAAPHSAKAVNATTGLLAFIFELPDWPQQRTEQETPGTDRYSGDAPATWA
jgi:hypothetical protein